MRENVNGRRQQRASSAAALSGLVAARRAKETFEFVRAYERAATVGGVWAYGHRSGGVFNSVLQNVTKLANAFADYPSIEASVVLDGKRRSSICKATPTVSVCCETVRWN